MMLLVTSLVVPYALVLASPGPNLLVMLRVSFAASAKRTLAAAFGIACGATLAATIAYQGSLFLAWADQLQGPFAILLAAILTRSAIRLMRRGQANGAELKGDGTPHLTKAFGLGIAASALNPMSIAFFLSFFVAHQGFLTSAWIAPVVVFVMAALWFSLVGICLGRLSKVEIDPILRFYVKLIVAISMVAYALYVVRTAL
ncbi:MAG TPA: LysE family transporter [Ensifer sp.]|jgi:threonine/homoserine/homoserine lactone efflux protein|uniref:LysE family translocator n=1 Tax=Ensifer sp. TaxID=1872086 RepID=UPI002E0F9634|nr:LysE family transporter [Ensifer sp.]